MRYDGYEDLTPPDATSGRESYKKKVVDLGDVDSATGPVSDREVPIPTSGPALVVHEWLDGEATDAMVRAMPGGNETADLWKRINGEAEVLRSRTTPLYVHKRIMESLPDDVYRVTRPWYRRPLMMNPVTLVAAAAALLGIGALVTRVLLH